MTAQADVAIVSGIQHILIISRFPSIFVVAIEAVVAYQAFSGPILAVGFCDALAAPYPDYVGGNGDGSRAGR